MTPGEYFLTAMIGFALGFLGPIGLWEAYYRLRYREWW